MLPECLYCISSSLNHWNKGMFSIKLLCGRTSIFALVSCPQRGSRSLQQPRDAQKELFKCAQDAEQPGLKRTSATPSKPLARRLKHLTHMKADGSFQQTDQSQRLMSDGFSASSHMILHRVQPDHKDLVHLSYHLNVESLTISNWIGSPWKFLSTKSGSVMLKTTYLYQTNVFWLQSTVFCTLRCGSGHMDEKD